MQIEEIEEVVAGSYCIGCGACAAMADSGVRMEITKDGRYQADLSSATNLRSLGKVCPFATRFDEDELCHSFDGPDMQKDMYLGRYRACFAGYVKTSNFREKGSSGGIVSWLAAELLMSKQVDAVVHVSSCVRRDDKSPLFGYTISSTVEDIRGGASSRYYPVEMSQVMRRVKIEGDKRYLFIGLPCFIKALRLYQREDEDFEKRIPFAIGLVCGHLKTMQFAQFYAYSLGWTPQKMKSINFRHKIPQNRVNDYGVSLASWDGEEITEENRNIFGTSWGLGFFKNNACDYCDDVLAETADITIGDAWLPAFESSWQGTNIVIVRHKALLDCLLRAQNNNEIHLDTLTAQDVYESQSSGIRHRREGLAYRLWLKEGKGLWHPDKRVQASPARKNGRRFRAAHIWRMRLARMSRLWFCEVHDLRTFQIFRMRMKALVFVYDSVHKGALRTFASLLPKSIKNGLKKMFR